MILQRGVTGALTGLTLVVLCATFPTAVVADGPGDGHGHSGEMGSMTQDAAPAGGDAMGMTMSASTGMSMGVADTWQNDVNRVAYPVTAVLALAVALVCYKLIQATGLVDKFTLIAVGLTFFVVQSAVGVLFYLTDGSAVDMPTLMFVMVTFNTLAMAFIGLAFLRWYRMAAN